MTAKLVEDLVLADDLEGADLPGIADWVRTHSTEEVDEIRALLLRALSFDPYADQS